MSFATTKWVVIQDFLKVFEAVILNPRFRIEVNPDKFEGVKNHPA